MGEGGVAFDPTLRNCVRVKVKKCGSLLQVESSGEALVLHPEQRQSRLSAARRAVTWACGRVGNGNGGRSWLWEVEAWLIVDAHEVCRVEFSYFGVVKQVVMGVLERLLP